MARRTAQELIDKFNSFAPDVNTEQYVAMLEDITDSVSDVDMSSLVSRSEYESVTAERDRYAREAKDYRDRYINRFYHGYDEPNSKAYVEGAAPQGKIEEEEKTVSYEDLFE